MESWGMPGSLMHALCCFSPLQVSLAPSPRLAPRLLTPDHLFCRQMSEASVLPRTPRSSLAPVADFDYPPEFSSCLDNSAAKHKLLVKPRNQRSSKMRRLSSVTGCLPPRGSGWTHLTVAPNPSCFLPQNLPPPKIPLEFRQLQRVVWLLFPDTSDPPSIKSASLLPSLPPSFHLSFLPFLPPSFPSSLHYLLPSLAPSLPRHLQEPALCPQCQVHAFVCTHLGRLALRHHLSLACSFSLDTQVASFLLLGHFAISLASGLVPALDDFLTGSLLDPVSQLHRALPWVERDWTD